MSSPHNDIHVILLVEWVEHHTLTLKELRSQLSVITVGKDHKPQLKENTIQGLFTVQTFHNQLYSNGNQLTADSSYSVVVLVITFSWNCYISPHNSHVMWAYVTIPGKNGGEFYSN